MTDPESCRSRSQGAYDVFLSFRGEDTRKNFTDHLYTALVQAGIHTFRDDNELPRGEEISIHLLKAIRESKISIVVFSKGYASSRWCLNELTEILECKNRNTDQIVLPIFYDIDPSDVRKQTGSFAETFDKHEERFQERVKEWRNALEEAGNLSGWNLNDMANGHEAKFIQEIIKDVWNKLDPKPLNVDSHLVGIDPLVQDINVFLSTTTDDVRIVGIHGMPGIGKTTLAKVIFNRLCYGFGGSCFLLNVKETSEQPNGLVRLQEQLLHDILKQNTAKIYNLDRGMVLIKERLCHKRILVVLDDLAHLNQLDALMGERNWFGPGSRVIIMTRDACLLLEVDQTYQVQELEKDQSLELFNWHAFRHTDPTKECVELSNDVVSYCGEVIGSSLFRRSILEWKDVIDKLQKIPDREIQQKLRISFDTLDDDKQKGMFLDIACFFVGMNKEYVAKILDGRGFFTNIGIRILVERSLIRIDHDNDGLMMHDLIRDMGREVIREMSPDHPGKHTRIWYFEDALNVLNKQTGTKKVEGITLDVRESGIRLLSTESFTKMRCLKLLQINGVHLTGSFKLLSEELIWLCWLECPLKSFPSDFTLDNLVVLDMQYSNIKELWMEKKILNKLKILNLSYSKHLVKTPNLQSSSLEKLMFEDCLSLVEVHRSFGHLSGLVLLNLEGCWRLKNLPESICDVKSLENLNISGCSQLEKLPELMGDIHSLIEVLADGIESEQFLSSVGHLKHVRKLSLCGYSFNQESPSSTSWLSPISSWLSTRGLKLKALLPMSFTGWGFLRELNLGYFGLSEGATNCVDFGSLSSLIELDLSGNKFFNLPAGIGSLPKLQVLEVEYCKNLVSISELPSSLVRLEAFACTAMERVRLPVQSKRAAYLHLTDCQNLIEIQGTEGVGNEFKIFSKRCYNLSNTYKRSLVEVFCNCDYGYVIEFTGGEMPNWFSYSGEQGCSTVSFIVPPVFQALIFWMVYESEPCRLCGWVVVRNKSKGITLFDDYLGTYSEDMCWVGYICSIEDIGCSGQELELLLDQDGNEIEVKECGIHVIAEQIESTESEWNPDIDSQERTSSSTGTEMVTPELYHHRLHHPSFGSITASTNQQWKNYLQRELPSRHINKMRKYG